MSPGLKLPGHSSSGMDDHEWCVISGTFARAAASCAEAQVCASFSPAGSSPLTIVPVA